MVINVFALIDFYDVTAMIIYTDIVISKKASKIWIFFMLIVFIGIVICDFYNLMIRNNRITNNAFRIFTIFTSTSAKSLSKTIFNLIIFIFNCFFFYA